MPPSEAFSPYADPASETGMPFDYGRGGGSRRHYRLVEWDVCGAACTEEFDAPDDAEAVARVLDVVEAGGFELWRGAVLVKRINDPG